MRYTCIRREEDMVSCPKEANLVKDCKECAYYAPFRWYDYVFITGLCMSSGTCSTLPSLQNVSVPLLIHGVSSRFLFIF